MLGAVTRSASLHLARVKTLRHNGIGFVWSSHDRSATNDGTMLLDLGTVERLDKRQTRC